MGDLLLVGLDNPQSRDPRYALFPRPAGCSGHRLLLMMQQADSTVTERDYIQIMKANLFPVGKARTGDHRTMQTAAMLMLMQLSDFKGGSVILVGAEVRDAFKNVCKLPADPMEFWVSLERGAPKYAWIPHPSGRNRKFNSRAARLEVGKFLLTTMGRGATITQRGKRR